MKPGSFGGSRPVSRKIAVLLLVLTSLLLSGCGYWFQDMKGFLEYWTEEVSLGEVEWSSSPESKTDSSGRTTVSTNATIQATAQVRNPDNYSLSHEIGSAVSPMKSVRIGGTAAETVMSLASVTSATNTSISIAVSSVSSVPTPASLALEHQDFTVEFIPTRSENGLSSPQSEVLSFRYNTPPRMPLEVIENGGSLKFLDGTKQWEVVTGSSQSALNNYIFWAWPSGITNSTHPDHVTAFRVTDGTHIVEKAASEYLMSRNPTLSSLVPKNLVDKGYDIYCHRISTPSVATKVEAVDVEGVSSQSAEAGRTVCQIVLEGNGGSFGTSSSVTVYRAVGASLTGGDLDVPTKSGHYLSGWTANGTPVTFPYTVSSPTTFTAQWTAAASSGGGSGGSAPVVPPVVDPHVMYVSPSSGEDTKDGLTVSTALKTIQAAVDKIVAANDGAPYTINVMGNVDDSGSSTYTTSNNALVNIVSSTPLNLTIKSDTDGTKRIIDAGRNSTTTGRVIYVGVNATVTMKDLVVTGGYSNDFGGGIHIDGGAVSLDNVEVSNNTAMKAGGGVYVSGGTLTMSGGGIYRNDAAVSGGGLFIAGQLPSPVTISGAKINENRTTYQKVYDSNIIYGGAAIFVENTASGTVAINSGSEIKDNEISVDQGGYTVKGVALHLSAANVTTTIEDTVISGNTITGTFVFTALGGGIYLDYGTLNLGAGAEISGHDLSDTTDTLGYSTVKDSYGGGLHLEHGTVHMTGGSIRGNQAKNSGAGIQFNAGTLNMGGATTVAADNDVYLGNGNKVAITSPLTGATPVATITPANYNAGIGVLSANPGVNLAQEVGKFAVMPNGGTNYSIIASGGDGILGHYDGTSIVSLLSNASSGDILDIKLTQNFNLSSSIEVDSGVTLNLSSDSPVTITFNPGTADIDSVFKCSGGSLSIGENITVDGAQQPTDNGMVYVDQGGTFTLRGKITNGSGTNTGGVSINGGSTFYMYDGAEISSCSATDSNGRQGGVRLSASIFYMYGGSIKNNNAAYDAGVRVIDLNGTPAKFYMSGGTITGNSAINTGGGVTVDNNCTFEMTGGSVTGNQATTGSNVYSYPTFTGTINVPPGTDYTRS